MAKNSAALRRRHFNTLFFLIWFTDAEYVIRDTAQGSVRGRKLLVGKVAIEEYQGIPYAESPSGCLRFKPPLRRSPWNETFDATRQLPVCPQLDRNFAPLKNMFYSEDCLRLNVWTPAPQKGKGLAVLVWLHGGGFTTGSAYSAEGNGTYLVARTGFVVVSINFRLGIFGFLNANSPEAPGNVGILDQNMALQWVQENIEAFGGDPSLVTLLGVSSGSVSANIHILSSLSKGLFKRAIMVSGSVYMPKIFDSAYESGRKANSVARDLGCIKNDRDLMLDAVEVVQCLRLKSVTELLQASSRVGFRDIISFLPTFHDPVLPKAPSILMERGFFSNVEVLTGVTSDEGAFDLLKSNSKLLDEISEKTDQASFERSLSELLSLGSEAVDPELLKFYVDKATTSEKEALRRMHIDYQSDRYYNCPMQYFAEKYSARENSIYFYIFGHKYMNDEVPKWMGVPHSRDYRFYFAAPLTTSSTFTEEDLAVTEQWVQVMASFAKHG